MSNGSKGNGARRSRTLNQPPGITGLAVRGFKSIFDERRIEVRPLTILAGCNSSGKSSALQPLLLLKQTLEATYDPGSLLLDGPNVRFTSASQLLSKLAGKAQSDSFSIEVDLGSSGSVTNTFSKVRGRGLEVTETRYRTPQDEEAFVLRPGMASDDIAAVVPKPYSELGAGIKDIFGREIKSQLRWSVDRNRCFLGVSLETFDDSRGSPRSRTIFAPSLSSIEQIVREVIHVPGLRGNPERTYKTTAAVVTEFPGTFENYVANIINHWKVSGDRRIADLGDALKTLGLTWKVEANRFDDTQVELLVGRLPYGARGGARDLVSIADVGFGVSQTLPVLVALLAARPGQLVYLEQPEIHLHPRAQTAMAQVLAAAAGRGVRLVVETHSSLLLLAIQALVAEGELAAEDVKLHWFKRRPDGASEVSSADLSRAGAFDGWPEDFGQVELELESRYLTAVEQREAMRR